MIVLNVYKMNSIRIFGRRLKGVLVSFEGGGTFLDPVPIDFPHRSSKSPDEKAVVDDGQNGTRIIGQRLLESHP